MSQLIRLYSYPGHAPHQLESTVSKIKSAVGESEFTVDTEICYYIETSENDLTEDELKIMKWILSVPFQKDNLNEKSRLQKKSDCSLFFEIGPRLNFSTASSTNCVSICNSLGINHVKRVETSIIYLVTFQNGSLLSTEEEHNIVNSLHDQMTQCRYPQPLSTFEINVKPDPVFEVDILGQGRAALEHANKTLGLAFDNWDLDYYTKLFQEKILRNPTSVECFDLAQSNSEHSRHWFFKGRLLVDGQEWPESLFSMIMDTQLSSNGNNVIKFSDNSSAIEGFSINPLVAENGIGPGKLSVEPKQRHIIFTAETHNFPTGVAPFPGATTGTGGRIRDVQATGRGAYVVAGTAGYSFGNLNIKGYNLPWEDELYKYPANFALPAVVAVEASNGASDYGNKFGEPVITGFARSFGVTTANGDRREYIKPIMFSGGIGSMEAVHVTKDKPAKDMEVVKVGGPVYRIGLGGGAASSVQVQGDNDAQLDFSAVQRGDAEMEQKMNRLIRACVERGQVNPIRTIHDQGAGGNGNVLKELVEPAGAVIRAKDFQLGDPTISVMELWGAEYQESNALLVGRQDLPLIKAIGSRERCPVCNVGTVSGTGKIQLEDFQSEVDCESKRKPVDLELDYVLGSMPRKVFEMTRIQPALQSLSLPAALTIQEALSRVLRLPSVGSKRYLTNKVDRSVTGLVAQQQCVGPLHTPLADVAVIALSHFDTVGAATSIGEQPVKGLLSPAAGARLTVAESLTNLMFASVTCIKDVKCSGNWMWPAKLDGEGVALLDACIAMCQFMTEVGVAVDGGKDSLSMAARVGSEVVKAPGTLVISTYVGCPDITLTVTPDLKCPEGEGVLIYLPASGGDNWRLGGSALAQCFKQLGDDVPDVAADKLVKLFNGVQSLVKAKKLTAGHDVSDGGLITCLLEMAFAGNCGLVIDIPVKDTQANPMQVLFAEEVGAVLEVSKKDISEVVASLEKSDVPYMMIGKSVERRDYTAQIVVSVNGSLVLESCMTELRDMWEETSFVLERMQSNPKCVQQEQSGLKHRKEPNYVVTFDPDACVVGRPIADHPKIAIIREEGSNGDREMAAAFTLAGFEAWDVNMEDLIREKISLSCFKGVAFVGGFSYADVCGSAKGWAATAKFNSVVATELSAFYARADTFSFGVCNGCQLMALLGWVAPDETVGSQGLLLDHNTSGRFESRFISIKVEKSPAIMLNGMEGTVWGMWVAHGEGRMVFKTSDLQAKIESSNLVPLRYVDDEGQPTETYPFNPNGSPQGIAGVCSPDGRHLALMPHPERCIWTWQCPWTPKSVTDAHKFSPWMKMFENAYKWCTTEEL
ncbi:phosphoribosylformylglycinamidine synthase [Biomphalaria glabrata]|uniref:Phosphoribosylformylglycinamidine synthase n=1 Tax=Biomphalaria glabrata TaxID=6526 RepID=A0A9W3B3G6_BIOGL|nr:phosphoribosylformylglycinamidine synthase-like [Biomphalaria glabrata]XP_055894000.1 phosphoribosylformylglycinamidine synthase-like [Biomphalaria glabrata]KAI8734201.1 phosphoribosylformylglycinamidine synthase-like [Biomphalaria glabrata]